MRRLLCSVTLIAGLLALVPAAPAAAEPEAFPGTNGLIAFDTDRDGNREVYAVAADGSNLVNLTNHPANDGRPAWSPAGTQIAFDSNRSGNPDIFVMQADGSGPVNLTNAVGDDLQPAWSPDGTQLAFDSTRDGGTDVFVMGADGSNPTNLTNTPGDDDWQAAWSPDGTRIAFASNRDGDFDIWTMNPDGSGLLQLTNEPGPDFAPAWAPDGSRLVFDSARDGDPEIWRMDADGSNPVALTDHPGVDVTSEASPEGEHLVFASDRLGGTDTAQIFVTDGSSEPVHISGTTTSSDFNPEWQVAPAAPPAVFRPDGRIALGLGAYVGNDVYNTTGAGQTRTGSAARGRAITFWVSIDNDGNVPQSYTVRGGQSAQHFDVQYFLGDRNVTGRIVDGRRFNLEVAESKSLRVRVTVRNTAPRNASVSRFVTITSVDDSTRVDRVKFTARRA